MEELVHWYMGPHDLPAAGNMFKGSRCTGSKSGGLVDRYGQMYQCTKAPSPKVEVKDVALFFD